MRCACQLNYAAALMRRDPFRFFQQFFPQPFASMLLIYDKAHNPHVFFFRMKLRQNMIRQTARRLAIDLNNKRGAAIKIDILLQHACIDLIPELIDQIDQFRNVALVRFPEHGFSLLLCRSKNLIHSILDR